jgi:hypothetical protein
MSKPLTAVKLVGETDDAWIIEGLILPYGGPLYGQDLTGTHFTKATDFCLEWFPETTGRPGLYAHGFDATVKASVVGREVKNWADDKGRWLQAQIDKAHEYAAEIKEMVDQGLLSMSSGAVDHLVQVATKSGEIVRWPWVEWSLVPNPANPEAIVYPVKSAEALDHLTAGGVSDAIGIVEGGFVSTKAVRVSRAAIAELEHRGVNVDVRDDGITVSRGMKAASDDASMAAGLISSIAWLMADEADEADQLEMLKNAVGWLQQFVEAELAEIGTSEDVAEQAAEQAEEVLELMAWLSVHQAAPLLKRIATREGRRNNADDQETIQSIHEATKALGADCTSGGGEKSLDGARLVITGPAPEPEVDLAALTSQMAEHATAKAKELLGR